MKYNSLSLSSYGKVTANVPCEINNLFIVLIEGNNYSVVNGEILSANTVWFYNSLTTSVLLVKSTGSTFTVIDNNNKTTNGNIIFIWKLDE